jgi:titin
MASATTWAESYLAPPVLVSATATTSTSVDLIWTDANTGSLWVDIERSEDGTNFQYWDEVDFGVNAYTDYNNGVDPDTTYWYRLIALNVDFESEPSNVISVHTPA